ncbi:hypothetical protein, partial [Mesorhizobium sp.]
HAHIGVGCIVRTDRPIAVELFAPRSSRHSFTIGARGIGASATSEGGLETTFMRGGQVLMAGTFPWWRRRGSSLSENARGRTGFTSVFPSGMGGRIDPGEYTFDVGIWAFADYASGIEARSAVAGREQHYRDANPSPRLNRHQASHTPLPFKLVVCVQSGFPAGGPEADVNS